MNNFVSFDEFRNSVNKKVKIMPQKLGNTSSKLDALNNSANISNTINPQVLTPTLVLELEKAKRQNGIVEKITDKIKGATGLGFSSKKIQNSIDKGENNTEIEKDIKEYRKSQENSAQIVGDGLSMLGAGFAFFKIKELLQTLKGTIAINKGAEIADFAKQLTPFLKAKEETTVKYILKSVEILTNNKTPFVLAGISAFFVGGFVKSTVLKMNRIGTKQYKPEIDKETMSKQEVKETKRANKKAKKNANFRNYISGAINGVTMPIIGILGVPGSVLYVALNTLNRYFIGSRENRGEKNIKSFVESIKNSPLQNGIFAIGVMIPLAKKGHTSKMYDKNIEKAVEKLKNAKLEKLDLSKSSYDEIEEVLFKNDEISKILSGNAKAEEKISQLSETNIFALKFLQIKDSSVMNYNKYAELTEALREKCPATRTIEEAQEFINKAFNSNYKVSKCLGVGTVAESYLVKDENGKEVCIKILKKGINAEKIEKDKQAIIGMIESSNKPENEKKFLAKNFENIANSVKEEINLKNEMDAAKKLSKHTTKANVVKGIRVSANNDAYIMEKADGISLASFMKLNELQKRKELYKKYSLFGPEDIEKIEKEIEEIKQKTPDFDSIILEDENQATAILEAYQKVLVEQFHKTDADGKVVHGDIHPGNVFIDFNKLKSGDKKFLTLIDTGNVLTQNRDQALRAMNLTKYIQNGDWDNISRFALEDAILPEGMSAQEALEKVSKDLKDVFFNDKTGLDVVNNDNILNITNTILKKYNIVPSDTQGALNKAKKSANNSLASLQDNLLSVLFGKIDENGSLLKRAGGAAIQSGKFASTEGKYKLRQVKQEKANLRHLPVQEKLNILKNKKAPSKNSEEYLTYKLKQYKFDTKDIFKKLVPYEHREFLNVISPDLIITFEKILRNNGIDISKLNKEKVQELADSIKELRSEIFEEQKSKKYAEITKKFFNLEFEDVTSNLEKNSENLMKAFCNKDSKEIAKIINELFNVDFFAKTMGLDSEKINLEKILNEILETPEVNEIITKSLQQ